MCFSLMYEFSKLSTFPAAWAAPYCLVTEAHVCEQLAQNRCMTAERPGVDPATSQSRVRRPNYCVIALT